MTEKNVEKYLASGNALKSDVYVSNEASGVHMEWLEQENEELSQSNRLIAVHLSQLETIAMGERELERTENTLEAQSPQTMRGSEADLAEKQRLRIGVLQNQLEKGRKLIKEAEAMQKNANRRIESLEKEIIQLKEQNNADLSALQLSLAESATRLETSLNQNAQQSRCADAAINESLSLKARLQGIFSDNERLTAEIGELRGENSSIERKLDELTGENFALALKFERAQTAAESLREQHKELSIGNIELNSDICELHAQLEGAELQMNLVREQCAAATERAVEREAESLKLAKQLAELEIAAETGTEDLEFQIRQAHRDIEAHEREIRLFDGSIGRIEQLARERLKAQESSYGAQIEVQHEQIREIFAELNRCRAGAAAEERRFSILHEQSRGGDEIMDMAGNNLSTSLERDVKAAREQIEQLKMELKAKDAQLQAGTTMLQSLNKESAGASQQITVLLRDKSMLAKELEAAKNKAECAENEAMKQVDAAKDEYELNIFKMESKIIELEAERGMALEKVAELDESENLCSEAEKVAAYAESELAHSQKALDAAQERIEQLETLNKGFEAKERELEAKIGELSAISQSQDAAIRLEEQLKAKGKEITDKDAKYRDIKDRFNLLTDDYNELFSKYTALAEVHNENSGIIQQEFDKLLEENSELQLHVSQLSQKESTQLSSKNQSEVAQLREEIAQLQEILEEKDARIRKMGRSNTQMIKNLSFTTQTFSKLRKEAGIADAPSASYGNLQSLSEEPDISEPNEQSEDFVAREQLFKMQIEQLQDEVRTLRASLEDAEVVEELRNNSLQYKDDVATSQSSLLQENPEIQENSRSTEDFLQRLTNMLQILEEDVGAQDITICSLNNKLASMQLVIDSSETPNDSAC